jgi:DNA topoisomerase-1
LTEREVLDLITLSPLQHFTQPPPRYTEASLVKALEERGIGRPSTYAPILSTLQGRGYVLRVEKRLEPTELGIIVNDLLVEHFPDVFDIEFTAKMEEQLDDIAQGRQPWVPVLQEFYTPFAVAVSDAEREMERVTLPVVLAGEKCEKCGREMVIKLGRFGKFIACPGFPECRNAKPFLQRIGVACPECSADIVERRTKKRRIFFGCSRYPECEWTSWQKPIAPRCPSCGGLLVEAMRDRAKCTDCGSLFPLAELIVDDARDVAEATAEAAG